MSMAAKKYLLGVANKNYMELVEKRKEEIKKRTGRIRETSKESGKAKTKEKGKRMKYIFAFFVFILSSAALCCALKSDVTWFRASITIIYSLLFAIMVTSNMFM